VNREEEDSMHGHIRRPRRDFVVAAAVVSTVIFELFTGVARVSAQNGGATSDASIKAAVMKEIAGINYGGPRPSVTVSGGVIMLSGAVSSLWLKEETINRALKVPGRTELQSDITISTAESDEKLAAEVVKRITGYDRFTVYDDFQGRVKNGVVYISGAVTEEKKLTDVVERVAKIRGVQAIDNKVTVLPANRSDDALRVAIANAIYRNPEFENYSMANPPIHVIVNNGYVTLTGIVRSEVEKIKAHESAASVFGSIKVDDRVRLAREVK
jgi:hyperosmotically inducible protein